MRNLASGCHFAELHRGDDVGPDAFGFTTRVSEGVKVGDSIAGGTGGNFDDLGSLLDLDALKSFGSSFPSRGILFDGFAADAAEEGAFDGKDV